MPTTGEDLNSWIVFGVAVGLLVVVAIAYHYSLPPVRKESQKWYTHLIYWAVAGATFAIPTEYSQYIFSALSVTFVGTVFPIYESLRAICTPDEDDDKYWLQFYMVGGIIFICTQFVDEWLDGDSVVYWHQAMCYLYLWLFFPKTDGSAIIYDRFTEPYLAPLVRPLTAKVNNFFSYIYHASINACHIVIAVLFFMFFPDSLKKIIAVATGTAYPLMASITAAGTEDVEDDTYWLTYWACYSCLFLVMELLETWLGWIPGFYTFYIVATLYLMLPAVQGADKVFRKILVPLARLQDLLILRDAIQIKKRIVSELDPEHAKAVSRAIVQFYANESEELDQGVLKKDLVSTWKGVQMPHFRNPFSRKKKNDDGTDAKEDSGTLNEPLAVDAPDADAVVKLAAGDDEEIPGKSV